MSKWISEQTNGVLKPDVSFQGNQLLTLLNTIYFKDEWMDRFERRQTKPGRLLCVGPANRAVRLYEQDVCRCTPIRAERASPAQLYR